MCYDELLLGGRRWMHWTIDGTAPRSYPATKTSLQTPTLRVCAWTTQLWSADRDRHGRHFEKLLALARLLTELLSSPPELSHILTE
jgi:hypothetical protein